MTSDRMGHTASSQRQVVDRLLRELHDYGRALRPEERVLYERLLEAPLLHFGATSNASSLHTWAFLLLSVMLEQEKRIAALEGAR